jgi:hypothetical protein
MGLILFKGNDEVAIAPIAAKIQQGTAKIKGSGRVSFNHTSILRLLLEKQP